MNNLWPLALVGVALTACSAPQAPINRTPQAEVHQVPSHQVLHFAGPQNLRLTLTTQDTFQTAVMTDNTGRTFQMRIARAASGVRMSDGQGVTIHFKRGEGMVEFVEGQPIAIQEIAQ